MAWLPLSLLGTGDMPRKRMTHFPVAQRRASVDSPKTHMGPGIAQEDVLCEKRALLFSAFVSIF